MDPIEFDQQTAIAAENQPQFRNMPMYRDKEHVIACWKLSMKDLLEVIRTKVIWVRLFNPINQMITPSLLETEHPWGSEEAPIPKPTDHIVDIMEWWYINETGGTPDKKRLEDLRKFCDELVET